jgi:hypothetical protein
VRRLLTALVLLASIVLVVAPADAKKHRSHKPSGTKGEVLNSTCAGACQDPPPPEPLYTGDVAITAVRVSDSRQVASQAISDGHFKLRLKKGTYDVSSVPPTPPTCNPTPQTVCPMGQAQSAAIVRPCLQGETKRVLVRRHRFTQVDLHVTNVCVV